MAIINQKKDGTKYKRSSLESQFERLWLRYAPDVDLHVELTLVASRRFRSDYTHVPTKTFIELHGGQFKHGTAHSTSVGKAKDSEKQNLLVMLGYKPLVLWTSQVTMDNIILARDFIKKEMETLL